MNLGPRSNQNRRPVLRVALTTALLAGALLASTAIAPRPTAAASTNDPTRTPATQVSADGRSATDGVHTLTVSQASELSPDGQLIRVTGSGYDTAKGVYVALCVIPPPDIVPTPCGGGVDIEGQAGASQWVSSNPPSYGVGLAVPYGPGGTFDTTFSLSAAVAPSVDCRFVRCAVLTRNDHTRSSDRSQDILIPVAFSAPVIPGAAVPTTPTAPGDTTLPAAPPPISPTTTPPTVAPTTTTTTTTPPAPAATISDDGRSVTDGIRTLQVERAEQLDPAGRTVTVSGAGFDPARGVYLALCAAPVPESPLVCSSGDAERSVWLSSSPPGWGIDLATPFESDGSFEVELAVDPLIDETTDCTASSCVVMVRSDDTAPTDRSLDLALPVTFADAAAEPDDTATADAEPEADLAASSTAAETGQDGAARPLALGLGVVVAGLTGAALVFVRRHGRSTP